MIYHLISPIKSYTWKTPFYLYQGPETPVAPFTNMV